MIIYLASIHGTHTHEAEHVLCNYARHADRKRNIPKDRLFAWMRESTKRPIKIFMDSGAFTVATISEQEDGGPVKLKGLQKELWRKRGDIGEPVTLELYAEFLLTYGDSFEVYANLDVIFDMDATIRNQEILESLGLLPLPVFHVDEPRWLLEDYLEKYEYVGIAATGMFGGRNDVRREWDALWSQMLTDSEGRPTHRIHAFGLTSLPLLFRYPWHSVDSTSWVQLARRGAIIVPGTGTDGEWDFSKVPHYVALSDTARTGTRGLVRRKLHIDAMDEAGRRRVDQYVEELGYDLGKLRESYQDRASFNIRFMQDVEREHKVERFVRGAGYLI